MKTEQVEAAPAAPVTPAPVAANVEQWTATEYMQHQKPNGWSGLVGFAAIALSVVAFFLLHDFVAPILFVLIAVAIIMYGKREPETLTYSVGPQGVTIGKKRFHLADFKSFSMIDDDGIQNLQLNPLKRLMPAITLYINPDDIDRIANAFSLYLPHEDKAPDAVDRLARKLRF